MRCSGFGNFIELRRQKSMCQSSYESFACLRLLTSIESLLRMSVSIKLSSSFAFEFSHISLAVLSNTRVSCYCRSLKVRRIACDRSAIAFLQRGHWCNYWEKNVIISFPAIRPRNFAGPLREQHFRF